MIEKKDLEFKSLYLVAERKQDMIYREWLTVNCPDNSEDTLTSKSETLK
jgi:hypothetical protein